MLVLYGAVGMVYGSAPIIYGTVEETPFYLNHVVLYKGDIRAQRSGIWGR